MGAITRLLQLLNDELLQLDTIVNSCDPSADNIASLDRLKQSTEFKLLCDEAARENHLTLTRLIPELKDSRSNIIPAAIEYLDKCKLFYAEFRDQEGDVSKPLRGEPSDLGIRNSYDEKRLRLNDLTLQFEKEMNAIQD